MNKHPSFLPVASALRGSMKQYNASMFRHDLLAAFVVSLVALPLSMALSIAVGLPPQHGLYTAIVAGIIVPLLGGSIWQVSGPTAAFVVILAPIVSQHGLRGIVWSGLIAGVILIGMGISRLGRLINYVPYPVTTGFTAGIAVVLAVLSLNDFMGLGIASFDGSFIQKLSLIGAHFSSLQPATLVVGVVTLALLFWGERIVPFMPAAMTAILVGTGLALAFTSMGYEVATIGSKFSYTGAEGEVVSGIPPYPPVFSWPTFSPGELFTIPTFTEFHDLLFPAVAIAILAAIESLLSATVADSMAGTKHDPNAELTGIGVGNVFSALAAGIPATGAIARTATVINNGARSPLASSIHAVLIMLYVLILAPYISYVPMAALAALLIHTAYRMSHYKQFIRTMQIAPGSDVVVLLVCFVLTVFIDMVAGVGIGMICASLLLIKRVMEMTQVEVEGDTNELVVGVPTNAPQFPKGTVVYRVRGPLFFGTIEKAFERYQFTHDYVKRFILDIRGVPFIDMTGLVAVKTMLSSIAREERPVHIICNSPEIQKKIQQKISDHHVKQFVHFHQSLDELQ
ncbi:STAS domain-containing protein [Paraneptunicella aestuarii]|uniref:SulP family inorganic anion transporter n=1 Tax=Paraneptunicella aestuarii TaxID=2831148 RepID=UPI001E2AEF3E|nr:SulP family inorganic anion transporter [Paraneptunicella aestuarii]UAA39947.1 STAS domain-containing protein [Paraneptunicella aestuarii]